MVNKTVRPIALCVFRRDHSIFVAEGYDRVKGQVLYRRLGGTIEFGEYGRQTAVHELREEIGANITNVRFLGTAENICIFDGQQGHEIVLLFEGEFVDKSFYGETRVTGLYASKETAVWKPIDAFLKGEAILYPDGVLNLLSKKTGQTFSD